MGKSKITSQNRLSYQNSASKHAVSSATLYGRPDISASDTSFLQKAERYKLFLRVQERQEKDQGTIVLCGYNYKNSILLSSQPANLNQPRSISIYGRATALMFVSSKLKNKTPVECDSYEPYLPSQSEFMSWDKTTIRIFIWKVMHLVRNLMLGT